MFTPVAELPFQSAFNYKEGSTTVLNLAGGFNISQHYVSTSRYVNWLCFSCFFGVPLGDIDFHFVWQAWHLATSTFTLCGRRGTCGTGLLLVLLFSACFAW